MRRATADIATSIVTFGFGAIGNAWATRGRHFGWIVLIAAPRRLRPLELLARSPGLPLSALAPAPKTLGQ